jgi:hypothetical protein
MGGVKTNKTVTLILIYYIIKAYIQT